MITTSLVILADRGGLKAYDVAETRTRGLSLHLMEELKITGLERELPFNAESTQHHVLLTKDWPALEAETNCRICQWLADRITKVVKAKRVEGWSFASGPDIHKAIVDLLPVAVRERIVEHVPSDLMKIVLAKLPSHFRSLQQIQRTSLRGQRPGAKRAPRRRIRLKAAVKR